MRKSQWLKWCTILMVFLFIESSFCEILHLIGGDFEIELAEKQFEDKLEKLEKQLENDLEKDKYAFGRYNRSDLIAFQNAYTSLWFKTKISFKKVDIQPPEFILS